MSVYAACGNVDTKVVLSQGNRAMPQQMPEGQKDTHTRTHIHTRQQ